MELQTINKLYLELSQFATAKTSREIELEEKCLNEDTANIMRVLLHDKKKGWGKISSRLTKDFENNKNCFSVRFSDGTERSITFSVSDT